MFLSYSTLIFLILIFILLALWQAHMRAKEKANQAAEALCKENVLWLLDQTVVLKKMKLKRTETGFLGVWRLYEFDYMARAKNIPKETHRPNPSSTLRRRGRIIIFNQKIIEANLKLEDGPSLQNYARLN